MHIYIRYKWIHLQNCVLYGNMLVILNKNFLFVSNSKIWISLGFLFQDVIEKCNLSGDYFNAYLHQNYLEFFSEISDVVRASEYLSDSDFMTFEWSVSDTIVLLSNILIHQVNSLLVQERHEHFLLLTLCIEYVACLRVYFL